MDFLLDQDWDFIIIGTGISGSTLGYALTQKNQKVLFIEKGHGESNLKKGLFPEPSWQDFAKVNSEELKKYGRYSEMICDESLRHPRSFIPLLGQGAGGSSLLYGAALERFFPEDFTPLDYLNKDPKANVKNWPFDYSQIEDSYKEAERLYQVHGGVDPLRSRYQNSELQVAEFTKEGQRLYQYLQNQQLHPYRLPVGHKPRSQSVCQGCQAFICSCDDKADALQVAIKPALQNGRTYLLSDTEVLKLTASSDRVKSLLLKKGSELIELKAKNYVLAAGALNTPKILLNSNTHYWKRGLANESGLIGHFFCRHFMDLLMIDRFCGSEEFLYEKEIAFNDFYFYQNMKLGTVQSLGNPPSVPTSLFELYQEKGLSPSLWDKLYYQVVNKLGKRIMGKYFSEKLCLAIIMEDSSYFENQVYVKANSQLAFKYQISDFDSKRVYTMRELIKKKFSDRNPILHKQAENNQRLAHASGTCRMGEDPKKSVVDKNNRVHGVENLFIVDASFFPSSAGINPALTLAANALRLSKIIA